MLVLVAGRALDRPAWDSALHELIGRHSTHRDCAAYDLIDEQTLDDDVESLHTRNGFLRSRMTERSALGFDAAVRRLVLAHQPSG